MIREGIISTFTEVGKKTRMVTLFASLCSFGTDVSANTYGGNEPQILDMQTENIIISTSNPIQWLNAQIILLQNIQTTLVQYEETDTLDVTLKEIIVFSDRAKKILQRVKASQDAFTGGHISDVDRGLQMLSENDLILVLQKDVKSYIGKNDLLCALFNVCGE